MLEAFSDLVSDLVPQHIVILDLHLEWLGSIHNNCRFDLTLLQVDLLLLGEYLPLHVLSPEFEVFYLFVGLVSLHAKLEHFEAVDNLVPAHAFHVRDASIDARWHAAAVARTFPSQ